MQTDPYLHGSCRFTHDHLVLGSRFPDQAQTENGPVLPMDFPRWKLRFYCVLLLLFNLQNNHGTWPHESYIVVKEKDDKEKNDELIIFTIG